MDSDEEFRRFNAAMRIASPHARRDAHGGSVADVGRERFMAPGWNKVVDMLRVEFLRACRPLIRRDG
jgi:hypothetical protein